ncbi:1-acyl-sn-glycerol-3-phosphate acyltransferase [Synergistales bacterium]|nr:1-acyl-sn-glycerol-3-phosphate acyltransferase [Synergistales bacterium]
MLQEIFYRAAKIFFRVIFTLYNRLTVRWSGGVPEGRVIVASNHASYIDPPLVGCVFRGRLRYLAKDSLFRNPLFGFLIGALGATPVARGDSQRAGAVLKALLSMLEKGESVLIFPEGTRSADGRLKPLEGGAAYLSLKSGVPLLPVYISGSKNVMPPHKSFPRPAKLVVTFGALIHPVSGERGGKGDRERVSAELEDALRKLEGESNCT